MSIDDAAFAMHIDSTIRFRFRFDAFRKLLLLRSRELENLMILLSLVRQDVWEMNNLVKLEIEKLIKFIELLKWNKMENETRAFMLTLIKMHI